MVSTKLPRKPGSRVDADDAIGANRTVRDSFKADAVLDSAEGTLNGIGQGAWLGPMAGAVAGGAISKLGKLTRVGGVQKAGEFVQGAGQKFNEMKVSDLSEMAGIRGAFTRVTQPVADFAANVANKVSEWTGFGNRRSNAHVGKAAVAHHKARSLSDAMNLSHAGEMPSELRAAVHELHGMAKGSAHHGAISHTVYEQANAKLEEAMKAYHKSDAKLSSDAKALLKQTKKLDRHLGDVAHHNHKSVAWGNVGQSIRNTPQNLSKANLSHVLVNGAFAAASVISIGKDTLSFEHSIKGLKQMFGDMTGTDPNQVSTTRILFGNVPAPIADVRGKLMANFAIKQGADFLNVGLQIASRMGPVKSVASMLGVGMVSSTADSMLDTAIIPVYKQFSEAYKKGIPISAEDYAIFLSVASKDLKNRGPEDPFVQELAKQYAAAKTSPAVILNEITVGKMMARMHGIMDANEAKKHPAASVGASHVDRLSGNAQAQRPVVGEKTAALEKQAQARGIEGGAAPAV